MEQKQRRQGLDDEVKWILQRNKFSITLRIHCKNNQAGGDKCQTHAEARLWKDEQSYNKY